MKSLKFSFEQNTPRIDIMIMFSKPCLDWLLKFKLDANLRQHVRLLDFEIGSDSLVSEAECRHDVRRLVDGLGLFPSEPLEEVLACGWLLEVPLCGDGLVFIFAVISTWKPSKEASSCFLVSFMNDTFTFARRLNFST